MYIECFVHQPVVGPRVSPASKVDDIELLICAAVRSALFVLSVIRASAGMWILDEGPHEGTLVSCTRGKLDLCIEFFLIPIDGLHDQLENINRS